MKIWIDPTLYIVTAFALLLLPPAWVIGWGIAAVCHESFHCIALTACGTKILEIKVGISGAVMTTHPMSAKEELIAAAAGPLGGLLVGLCYKWIPITSICAMIQTAYNLLPVHPMDGGRILSAIVEMFFRRQGQMIVKAIGVMTILFLVFIGFYLGTAGGYGLIPIVASVIFALKSMGKYLENN